MRLSLKFYQVPETCSHPRATPTGCTLAMSSLFPFSSGLLRAVTDEIKSQKMKRADEKWAEGILRKHHEEFGNPCAQLSSDDVENANTYLENFLKRGKDLTKTFPRPAQDPHLVDVKAYLATLTPSDENEPRNEDGSHVDALSWESFCDSTGYQVSFQDWYSITSAYRGSAPSKQLAVPPIKSFALSVVNDLPVSWAKKLDFILTKSNPSETVIDYDQTPITRADVATLVPNDADSGERIGWLNDIVINTFLRILTVSRKTRDGRASTITINSLLAANLSSDPKARAKKAGLDASTMPTTRRICLYDSQSNRRRKELETVRDWLVAVNADGSAEPWVMREEPSPQQADIASCGVFVCANALFGAFGFEPYGRYSQDNIPALRRYIAAIICKGDYPFPNPQHSTYPTPQTGKKAISYQSSTIRQLFISKTLAFTKQLSAADLETISAIWSQLDLNDSVNVPKSLLDRVQALPSTSLVPSGDQWCLQHQSRWLKFVGYTGSTLTLFDYADRAVANTLKVKIPGTGISSSTKTLLQKAGRVQRSGKSNAVTTRGIENLGATCFLAAAVRLVWACGPLRAALVQTSFSDQTVPDPQDTEPIEERFNLALDLTKQLKDAVNAIKDVKAEGPYRPVALEKSLRAIKSDWVECDQQDAVEAWLAFMEALNNCTNNASGEVAANQYPAGDRIVDSSKSHWQSVSNSDPNSCGDRPFLGQYVFERVCLDCHNPKPATFQTYNINVVPMPDLLRTDAAGKAIKFQTLLHAKYQQEIVSVECESCDAVLSFSQQFHITRLPEYLVFTLNRFEGGATGGKIKDSVFFEVDGLNMVNYGHLDMRSGDSSLYDCCTAVHHIGSAMRADHYVAYVREVLVDGQGTQWACYNDEVASVVQEDEIMGPTCYMIMYRRRESMRPPSSRDPTSSLSTPPPPSSIAKSPTPG